MLLQALTEKKRVSKENEFLVKKRTIVLFISRLALTSQPAPLVSTNARNKESGSVADTVSAACEPPLRTPLSAQTWDVTLRRSPRPRALALPPPVRKGQGQSLRRSLHTVLILRKANCLVIGRGLFSTSLRVVPFRSHEWTAAPAGVQATAWQLRKFRPLAI